MGRYGGAFAGRVDDAADTSAEAKAQRVVAMFPADALPATTLIVPETQTRDRCRFSFSRTTGDLEFAENGVVGPVAENGHRLASQRVSSVLNAVVAELTPTLSRNLRAAHVHAPRCGSEPVVALVYEGGVDDENAWLVDAEELRATVRCSLVGRFKGQALICGNDFAREILSLDDGRELTYEFPEGSFCHPNGSANERSESWLCARAATISGNLLELYCGAGTHTCALSKYFARVIAVEVDAKLVEAAQRNLAANHCANATVVADSVGKRRGRLHSVLRKRAWDDVRFDCILVDPPRRGLDDATLGALAGFSHVLVVACNPEKLARDCDVLLRTHAVAAFAGVDGFPGTPHVECLAHFVRRDDGDASAA